MNSWGDYHERGTRVAPPSAKYAFSANASHQSTISSLITYFCQEKHGVLRDVGSEKRLQAAIRGADSDNGCARTYARTRPEQTIYM